MPYPPPEPFRGSVARLDPKCGVSDCLTCARGVGPCAQRCETWVVLDCMASVVPSLALGEAGTNYGNYKGIAAAGGRPVCPGSPLFSRVSISVPNVAATPEFGAPAGSVPPPIHIEVRFGHEGVVSRVARLIWTPTTFEEGALICQVSGILASRVEIWAWCELAPGAGDFGPTPLPVMLKFEMLIDRQGGARDVWLNDLANVTADAS